MARILIVDDAVFMRTVLRDILSDAGHEIVGEAATGEEAITQYDALKPELVTMDLVMPGEGGIAALGRIVDKDPKARVLIVSAQGQKEDLEEALERGALGYLVKPFDADDVVQKVANALATDQVHSKEAQ